MPSSFPKIVVGADVILDHLHALHSPSVLRIAQAKFFCYTTVFHAIEVFSRASSDSEVQAMEDAMASMKLLGLSARNAQRYGALLRAKRPASRWEMLVAGLCMESRLPLLTGRASAFRRCAGLTIVSPRLVSGSRSGEDILRVARSRGIR
jgi:hypothetical protein